MRRPDGLFDLTRLLAGPEDTLAVTGSITLRLAPRPGPETGERSRLVLGCSGMAGMFGHEVEPAELSRRIFDLIPEDGNADAFPSGHAA